MKAGPFRARVRVTLFSLSLAGALIAVGRSSLATAQPAPSCLEYQNYLRLLGSIRPTIHGYCDFRGYPGMALAGGILTACEMNYGLHVLDVSDPRAMQQIAELPLPGSPTAIARMGELAVVVGNGPNALRVVDLSNPAAPAVIGTAMLTWGPVAAAVSGTLAYVACNYSGGLLIYDLAVPQSPALIGQLPLPLHGASDVALRGTTAVLACAGSVRVVDVSDPASPHETGSVALPWPNDQPMRRLALRGDEAFVTGTGGLAVVDLSGLTPSLTATLPLSESALSVAVSGNLVCVGEQTNGIAIIDATDPAAPTLVGQAKIEESWPECAVCDGTTLLLGSMGDCMGSEYPAFYAFDISHPAPAPVASVLPDSESIAAIAAEGTTLVGAGYGAFEVFDASNPSLPLRQARIWVPGYALDVAADGGLACVEGFDTWNGFWLKIVDFSTPTAPVTRGRLDVTASSLVAMRGRYAYRCTSTGVATVDVSNPDAPATVGWLAMPGGTGHPQIADDLLYVAGANLSIIDISNPVALTVLSTTPVTSHGLAIDGHHGYTCKSVIDLTNPLAPQVVGTFPEVLPCWDVVARNGIAYIMGDRVQVVDARVPTAPLLLGSILAGTAPWEPYYPSMGAFAGDALALCSDGGWYVTFAWPQCDAPLAIPPALPPGSLRLFPAVPNPFNPATTIRFELPRAGQVSLAIYDVRGRLVRRLVEAERPAGTQTALWDGRDDGGRPMPSGSYFARVAAAEKTVTSKLQLVR